MSHPVTVPCRCLPDGTRHPEGDVVTLRDTLPFVQAQTARNAVLLLRNDDPDASVAEILAVLTEQYVLLGLDGWTLCGADGKPLDLTRAAVRDRILGDDVAASIVANAADDLYASKVMLPLLRGASTSSPHSPTTESTSPATGSEPMSPTPSSPSSTSTTPTAVTATTSKPRAGGSRSLPSSASAA